MCVYEYSPHPHITQPPRPTAPPTTDCKHIDEAALVQALERAAASPSPDDDDDAIPAPTPTNSPSAQLQVLRLRWCGQAFGKKAIEAFARLGLGAAMEALELTGMYRLKDEDLIAMIAAVRLCGCFACVGAVWSVSPPWSCTT